MLWAIERHLDGRPGTRWCSATLACLLRPELVPFLGLYGLWAVARRAAAAPAAGGGAGAAAAGVGRAGVDRLGHARSTAARRRAASRPGACRWPSIRGCGRWSGCTTTPGCRWSCWRARGGGGGRRAAPRGGAGARGGGAGRGGAVRRDDAGRLQRQPALRAAGAGGAGRCWPGWGRRIWPGRVCRVSVAIRAISRQTPGRRARRCALGRRGCCCCAPGARRRTASRDARVERLRGEAREVGVRMQLHRDLARAVQAAGGAGGGEGARLGHRPTAPSRRASPGSSACRWS